MENAWRGAKLFGCKREKNNGGQSDSKYNTIGTEKSI